MFKRKKQQGPPEDPDNPNYPEMPKFTVTDGGGLRIDSASLLRLPKVQAQIKALRNLKTWPPEPRPISEDSPRT